MYYISSPVVSISQALSPLLLPMCSNQPQAGAGQLFLKVTVRVQSESCRDRAVESVRETTEGSCAVFRTPQRCDRVKPLLRRALQVLTEGRVEMSPRAGIF